MKRQPAATGMIRLALALAMSALPLPAFGAELSPWFGSADQTAFQLDPHTMVAVTFAADPLQTGSLKPKSCTAPGCTPMPKAGRSAITAAPAPKN